MTPEQILKQYFGYDEFRLHQRQVIETCLRGEDSLVIMPTGGGKSICYQVPALIMDGVTIVVSPLIALMKDQVDGLKSNGVAAEFLNSSISPAAQRNIISRLKEGKIKLLYLAPERISQENSLNELTGNTRISLIAIDEAHCISHWGHDFRPDYLVLGTLKKQYPGVPVMALTASADGITREDIITQLNLTGDNRFISSFNRPNISYFIHKKERFDQFLPAYLDRQKDSSGIIYCLSRKSTEELAQRLVSAGYSAACYHAGLERDERHRVQEDFIHDRIKIIVATIAFGMGIDKSDVRFVIHADLPKNIESYYQETGRAGRDGMPSDAILFFGKGDLNTLRFFIDKDADPEFAAIMHKKLDQIVHFAQAHKCRRQMLMNYFDEEHHGKCNACDYCLTNYDSYDGTKYAQMALSAVVRLQERFGINLIIEFLRGAKVQRITEKMRTIKTYGVGRELSEGEWQDIISQMINQGLVAQAGGSYPVLTITDKGWQVLRESLQVTFLKPVSRVSAEKFADAPLVEEELVKELKRVRKVLADMEYLPAYIVLSDSSIMELAQYRPFELDELHYINGFGEYKIEKYGRKFIECIRDYCMKRGLRSLVSSHKGTRTLKKSVRKKFSEPKLRTADITLQLFKDGNGVTEIAVLRQLNSSTIQSHLASFLRTGQVRLSDLVSADKVDPIKQAIHIHGTVSLATLRDHLGESFDYGEIRAVIEHQKITEDKLAE